MVRKKEEGNEVFLWMYVIVMFLLFLAGFEWMGFWIPSTIMLIILICAGGGK
ncbi:hypothetical protein LCGC14_1873980 [marine sediment metagenome]|uniref:Uncharacterized protein n=1 Tax=marine sediment metagenome TaxID=412755 RepID=A0A0F9J2W1_9ZZZZ